MANYKFKNATIAAIVAVVVAQIAQEGITPEAKKDLEGVRDSLIALDQTIGADQDQKATSAKNLQAAFDQLSLDKKTSDDLVISLQEKIAGTPDNSGAIETFKSQIEEFKSQLVEAKDVIADLHEQLELANAKVDSLSPFPVGELNGIKHEVLSGALGYGTAAEIAADPEKLAKLTKIKGQTVVRPLIS